MSTREKYEGEWGCEVFINQHGGVDVVDLVRRISTPFGELDVTGIDYGIPRPYGPAEQDDDWGDWDGWEDDDDSED